MFTAQILCSLEKVGQLRDEDRSGVKKEANDRSVGTEEGKKVKPSLGRQKVCACSTCWVSR